MLGGCVKHNRIYALKHERSSLTFNSHDFKRHDAFDLPDIVMRERLYKCLLREKQQHATLFAQNAQRSELLPLRKILCARSDVS